MKQIILSIYLVIVLVLVLVLAQPHSSFSFTNSKFTILPGDTVFKRVDVAPRYKGGNGALYKFIDNNINYPEEAKMKKIEGKVVVEFVVDRTGRVSNPKIFRGVYKLLDEEAIRVISLLPKWMPGTIENKPVPCYVKMPVHFKIDK
jgi:periplasmic protein TonB